MVVVGVGGKAEVRQRRAEVEHGGELDAKLAGGVNVAPHWNVSSTWPAL